MDRHFFQPLLPGFHTHLNIPLAFFSKHMEGRNDQNKTAKLRSDASDKTWTVKMDGLKLTQGWEEFAVAHDLQIGDITVFRHEGEMVFHVTPLGPSCCEIQYTPPHNIIGNNSSRVKKKNPRESSSDHSCFVAKVSASSLSYDRLYIPRSFARSNGLTKMCVKRVILVDQEGRSWKLDLKHDKACMQSTFLRPGWRKFCSANGMNNGHCTFKMVRKSGTPIIRLCHADQHRPKSESESSLHHSYFQRSATLTSLQQDSLYLPKGFVISNGLNKGCSEVILKNDRGGRWTLVLKHYKGQTYLRRGWTSFCQENGIKAGDSFMLKLVGSSGESPVLSLCPAHSKDPLESEKESVEDKRTSQEFLEMKTRKHCSGSRASSSYSQNQFVTLKLTPKAFQTYKMILPQGFTRTNGINKSGKITMLGQDGVKQVVHLFREKSSGTMRLGKGWRHFCAAQGVKINESFVLELIWDKEASPVLKFCTKLNSV